MKAIVRTKAGKEFSTLQVQTVTPPKLQAHEIRVKMISSRINPVDMDLMKGFPSLKYKTPQFGGIDGAGEIIACGAKAKQFSVGQKVFFYRLFSDIGTWAEEITIPEAYCAPIPMQISGADAGAIALPLLTAYEGVMALQPKQGQSILIHGAGGGVGFQAVQIAKALGLKVIANASERDKTALIEVGVDQFIDYKKTDFLQALRNHAPDFIFDVVGNDTLKKSILLKPKAVVSTTFPDVASMHKTGVNLPGLLKFVMRQMNRKYRILAKKQGVKLIGQVTGANGKHLQQAAALIDALPSYVVRPQQNISLTEVTAMGLSKSSVGKVLLFDA